MYSAVAPPTQANSSSRLVSLPTSPISLKISLCKSGLLKKQHRNKRSNLFCIFVPCQNNTWIKTEFCIVEIYEIYCLLVVSSKLHLYSKRNNHHSDFTQAKVKQLIYQSNHEHCIHYNHTQPLFLTDSIETFFVWFVCLREIFSVPVNFLCDVGLSP